MKSVLIIFPNDKKGGAETVLKIIAKELMNLHFDVQIFSLQNKVSTNLDEFNTKFISANNKFIGFLKFIYFHKKNINDYDFIFSSQIQINGLICFFKPFLFSKSKLIIRESTQIFDRFSGWRLSIYLQFYRFYKNANIVITQTELMKKSILENFKKSIDWTILTIPNPISLPDFKTKFLREPEFTIPKNSIVAAGRLIKIKGFDILIKAYFNLKKFNFPLIILGDGPEKLNLKNLINQLKIDKYVFLFGEIDNPFPYFKFAKMCVISSVLEGFPNVLLEMIYCNNNIVSTLCAGDIENINGVIKCKPNNINEMTSSLSKALSLTNDELIKNRFLYNLELQKRDVKFFVSALNI